MRVAIRAHVYKIENINKDMGNGVYKTIVSNNAAAWVVITLIFREAKN